MVRIPYILLDSGDGEASPYFFSSDTEFDLFVKLHDECDQNIFGYYMGEGELRLKEGSALAEDRWTEEKIRDYFNEG